MILIIYRDRSNDPWEIIVTSILQFYKYVLKFLSS